MPDVAFVALGSNLGDRRAYLAAARNALSLLGGTTLSAASAVEETAPFGVGAQAPYLNQMVALRTLLPPLALLRELHRIERALGRTRSRRWGARTIDLDIVRYGAVRLQHTALVLPHPGFASRDFWQREAQCLEKLLCAA